MDEACTCGAYSGVRVAFRSDEDSHVPGKNEETIWLRYGVPYEIFTAVFAADSSFRSDQRSPNGEKQKKKSDEVMHPSTRPIRIRDQPRRKNVNSTCR